MSDLLSIGVSGLNVSKKALETTGHNLANANTEGYSRQRVSQTTNTPISKGGLIHGSGARIVNINRVHDTFVEKRLNSTISEHEFFKERSLQLEQVENIFNEIDNEGLNKILNRFYNSFRELANQPENETIRSVVRDNASLVVKDFHRIRETVDNIARNIDKKIEMDVVGINQITEHVSILNKKINEMEVVGAETGDLRDQRDLAIRNLSAFFEINTYTDNRGNYNVAAKGLGSLVSGGSSQRLAVMARNKDDSTNNMAGSIEIVFEDRPQSAVTSRFVNGTFASQLKMRNDDIRQVQDDVDQLAFSFIQTTNAVHRKGFVNRQIAMDQEGNPVTSDKRGPTTGIDFFAVPLQAEGASLAIDLSEDIKNDLTNIATSIAPNSPGDNRIAIGISKLQHEKLLDEGNSTIEEKFLQTVGNVGVKSGKARLDSEQSEGILAQTKSIRERLSGVSVDEETSNMVRYQQAYDASAKVIKSADEMFKTVLGLVS